MNESYDELDIQASDGPFEPGGFLPAATPPAPLSPSLCRRGSRGTGSSRPSYSLVQQTPVEPKLAGPLPRP